MFRKLLSSTVALSVAFAPITASAANETYMFRYVSGLGIDRPNPEIPAEPEEYGIGNDITAYYVAPMGFDFSKKIPVATQDVVDWRKDTGDMPTGLFLDQSTGLMSGRPTVEGQQSLLYRGWDAGGNRIARAALNFTVFKPVGVGSELSFYGHTGTYFYQTIPLPKGVDVYRWEPIVDYPEGMSMKGLAFQGTPAKAGTYAIAWRGYNYVGREVAFAFGEFLVEDGPKIEHIEDQFVSKATGRWFGVRPEVKNSLGTLVYSLVPEEGRPEGLSFFPETGRISGIYPTYNTSAKFHIDVTDSADGRTTSSNTFTLATLPQDLELCCIADLEGTVNSYFWQRTAGSVADGKYEVLQGQLPEGLEISEKSGIIYGTPKKTEVQEGIVIGVSGAGVATEHSSAFKFTVYPEEITAKITPLHARTGGAFSTNAPVVMKGNIAPFNYALAAGASIDPRLTLEPSSGTISSAGIVEPGTYDATFVITNADGQTSTPIIQPVAVHNPLSVAYSDTTVKRLQSLALDPVIDKSAIVGRGVYRVAQGYVPGWMEFNSRTGRFSGTPLAASQERVYGPYTVTLEDETGDVQPSAPFTITVAPRDDLAVDILNDVAERYVQNQKVTADAQHAYGNVRYTMTAGTLGGTLKISESGVLVGSTEDPVGTIYSGIVVTARDEDDSIGKSSAPFSITVVAPSDPKPLLGSFDLTEEWAAGTPFSFALPELSNGYGTVVYALAAPSSDVSVSSDGTISGTLAAGTHSFEYTVTDDVPGRTPARGTITIVVKEPMTVAMDDVYQANVGSRLSIVPVVTNPVGAVTYQLSGALPGGLAYKDGVISKAPSAEGLYNLSLIVTDEAGTTVPKQFAINVGPALPFSVTYEPALLRAESAAGLPVQPKPVSPLGKMTYALKSGLLPLGVDFKDGYFVGTPHETGAFPFVVDATDMGLDAADTADDRTIPVAVELKVAPAEDMSFPQTSFTVRKGAPFSLPLKVDDAFGAVSFATSSAAGIPYELILSPAGALTGSLAEAKAYDGIEVKATDDFGRIAEATLTITAVDALTASIPATVDFKQYSEGSASVAAVNPAGTLSYDWAAGSAQPPQGVTLNGATGGISGTPEVFGDFPGYRIAVTDSFDGTTAYTDEFTIKIAERDPLVLTPPAPLALKRFSVASARASVADPVGSVVYDVAPDLPVGIDLNKTSGEISGSSDEIVPSTVHTLTATDEKAGDLGTDVKTFTLEVAERDPLQIVVADSIVFKQHGEDRKGATAKDPVGAVQWAISPALPDGLTFSNGVISGNSHEVIAPAEYTITAVDSKGGELGSDEVKVTLAVEERAALAPSVPASYEFNQFFEGGFAATVANVLGAASWSFSPALPDWMIADVDAKTGDLKISGTPQDLMDPTDYALTVSDTYDTATPKTVSISVGERKPLKIKTAAADGQTVELPGLIGYPFTTKLDAENSRGALTWRLVSGTLPADVTFDEAKGTFKGTASVYGSFPGIVISVADEKGGMDQRSFTLNIGQDGSPITIEATDPSRIHVGMAVSTLAPTVTNSVGTVTFSATGLAGTGLSINPSTGVISGTPKAVGQIKATVYVTDITQRIPPIPATVTITVLPAITVEAAADTAMVYNYDPTVARPIAKESVPANVWSLKSGKLPAGVTVDPATGSFVGKPKEVGTFGPIVLSVTDSLGGTGSSENLTIKVKMNDDPIDLTVSDLTTHVGFDIRTQAPVYGNELGTVTFFSPDAVAQGLSINPATGVISGKIGDVRDVIINVSIRDTGTLRVTSRPLKLQILPPVEVVLPAKVTLLALEQMTAVAPTVQYAVGAMVWDPISDPAKLPPGVSFDASTGSFKGMPTDLGTFGPVTVSGTDAVGGRGVSEEVSFEVRPGAKFIGLADSALPAGVKRSDWSFDFSTLATIVGFEPADLDWSIVAPKSSTPPAGLTASGTVLSGQPNKSGDYLIEVTVKPKDTKSTVPAVTKTYALKVTIPQTSITLPASLPGGDAIVPYSYDFKTSTMLQNVPMASLSWSLILDKDPATLPQGVVNDLPPGMALDTIHQSTKGLLSGTPTKGGTYVFSIKAQFRDSEEDVSDVREYTLEIEGAGFAFKSMDSGLAPAVCGVTTDDRVACWGNNNYGQAGDGSVDTYKKAPVYVADLQGVASVAVGQNSACAVLKTGSVKCWGRNNAGQLGDGSEMGTALYSAVPVDVVGISDATSIDGYENHFCVGLSGGGAKCWGQGSSLQLGNGVRAASNVPVDVGGLTGSVSQIALNSAASCALLANNTVWCWGTNVNGNLGNGTEAGAQSAAVQIGGLLATSIGGGDSHYCVRTTAGEAKCWGRGNNWQLGPGSIINSNKSVPTLVAGMGSGVRSVTAGYLHSCAVMTTGGVKCWGYDNGGQQGDGLASFGGTVAPYGANIAPVQVIGLTSGVASITGGQLQTCAVMTDGKGKCWGSGRAIGNGTGIDSAVPMDVGTE